MTTYLELKSHSKSRNRSHPPHPGQSCVALAALRTTSSCCAVCYRSSSKALRRSYIVEILSKFGMSGSPSKNG